MTYAHCTPPLLQILLHVHVEVFEDEVKFIIAMHDVEQFNNVWVVKLFEERDLADGSARNALF